MLKLTNEQKLYLEFSILCGYRVLPVFENKYPEDARPRNALEAAWAFFAAPSKKTKADAAAYAASSAASADAAYAASSAAAANADAAAYVAHAAAAAYVAHDAAYVAVYVAAYAAHDAATDAAAHAYVAAAYAAAAHDAAYVAVYVAERRFQFLLLSALNTKYKLSIKIKGVE